MQKELYLNNTKTFNHIEVIDVQLIDISRVNRFKVVESTSEHRKRNRKIYRDEYVMR